MKVFLQSLTKIKLLALSKCCKGLSDQDAND